MDNNLKLIIGLGTYNGILLLTGLINPKYIVYGMLLEILLLAIIGGGFILEQSKDADNE